MSAVLDTPRHRFSRVQYERMVEAGVFDPNDRLELLDGEIIDMSPQKSRHATAVTLVGDALRRVFATGATVRVQLPFCLDDRSEPEPDVAIVPGYPRDYRDVHPSRAMLIVEVSDTTLTYDCGSKLAAYARAGVPEYWVLDLAGEVLKIFRKPESGVYTERYLRSANLDVRPPASSQAIAVRDLLP